MIRSLLRRPARLIRGVYGKVRRYLPDREIVLYAGLKSPIRRKLGDRRLSALVPYWDRDEPGYEDALVAGLLQTVRAGDRVTVIGGGMGITTALAAQLAGPTGHVICYEGAIERIAEIELTARLNGVGPQVEARNAIVGEPIDIYGGTPTTTTIRATDLPECDVLELDCEGSERGIFDTMSIRPRAIVVETHGLHNSPTAHVEKQLDALGYAVTNLGVAETRIAAHCHQYDVMVLVGVRR